VPKAVEVPAGTPVILKVANQGAVPHNLTMDAGPKTPDLKPGGTATLDLGTVTKTMPGYCSVPGHKDAGMTFEVRVSGPTTPPGRRPRPRPPRTTAPSWTPMPPHRPAGNPTTRGSPRPPAAASTS
jgi:nitrite reductase (NO-forming)